MLETQKRKKKRREEKGKKQKMPIFMGKNRANLMRMILIWKIPEDLENLLFPDFWRGGASANVKYFYECYPEMCDQLGNQGHSLYFGAGAPVIKRVVFRSRCLRRLYST